MKIFISACASLILIFMLILFGTFYCADTADLTLSAIDDLEKAPNFSADKAERIYADFEKRATVLRYFTVSSYIDEVQIPLSALRYAQKSDAETRKTLIEEARFKLEKLRSAGTFSFATVF